MSNLIVLLILALALIVGAVVLGVTNHPWLCLLIVVCLAGLRITNK